jgi:hypothetical protein
MRPRKPYPTDLTDAQWQRIEGFFCVRPKGQSGRPREYSYREIVNAILYLVRTGSDNHWNENGFSRPFGEMEATLFVVGDGQFSSG